ncbi:MAG: UDP-N-acetylglucosamine 2-epimerase (non-hydrolyzing) [Bacteroidales bacterium]|nr:MAG: UDP-N-acetylglucosamine 2-epimerase (non-hydrolyzing) [Bacteroidales bacterium]
MKVITIVGARPQFIKLGSFSRELRKFHTELIIHTGQHFDSEMSDLFFRDLEIPQPDFNLNINGGTHGQQTSQMISSIETILIKEQPQLVVVFGDTNSTLAGALATVKLGIPCLHVEAGLRSFNRSMPEEINRVVADHTSDYLFAPTQTAMINMEKEGLSSKAFLTGDIMVDSLSWGSEKAKSSMIMESLGLHNQHFSLLTLHRPYNVDDPLTLSTILSKLIDLRGTVVFPIHPRTKSIVEKNGITIPSNFVLTKPLGYLDFIKLQEASTRIITDSGGIQKEAFLLKKPCITLRSETEWVETVAEGWNLLLDVFSPNLIGRIESFNPTHKAKQVFGLNVTKKMISIINNQFIN